MTLSFPNESRSYDERRKLVRFWGHDSAMEIAFLVEVEAFCAPAAPTADAEAAYLKAFDAARKRIHEIARRAYAGTRKGTYLLVASDF